MFTSNGHVNASGISCTPSNTVKPGKPVGSVHFNWGTGSPVYGMGINDFCAEFDKVVYTDGRDYFAQTFADDGVRVKLNDQDIINRWSNSAGTVNQTALPNLSGKLTFTTQYYEKSGDAAVFSDLVPFGYWLAYYYNNETLSGKPINARTLSYQDGNLVEVIGKDGRGSPMPKTESNFVQTVKEDYFSSKYYTAMRLEAGEYIITAGADDGVKVFLDGKEVLNSWKSGKYQQSSVKVKVADTKEGDIHWLEVHYFEKTGVAKLDVSIEPFVEDEYVTTDQWFAKIYPNKDMKGIPVVKTVNNLDLNWGTGSPHFSIPTNHFSAVFTKKVKIDKAGYYDFNAQADDGVQVLVNGQKVIDSWVNSNNGLRNEAVYLEPGIHTVRVKYFEATGGAKIKFTITALPTVLKKTTSVKEDWNRGKPQTGFPEDHFYAVFNQSQKLQAGDYFIQSYADDGVRVEVDGNYVIDRWTNAAGKTDRGLITGLKAGTHSIKTHYFESGAAAYVYSDIVPFDSWLAYYYNNTTLSGRPANTRVIEPSSNGQLVESISDGGLGAPMDNVNSDYFTAKYVTAKRLPAGDYLIRAGADDAVKVYVDDKLVLDRWTASKYRQDTVKVNLANTDSGNVHWIEVHYLEKARYAQLDVTIEPYDENTRVTEAGWIGEIYPTIIDPYRKPNINVGSSIPFVIGDQSAIENLDFSWGKGSPHTKIPSDHFSAIFKRKITLAETGTYTIQARADDGVIVEIDGKRVIDSWKPSSNGLREVKNYQLSAGTHDVKVYYSELTGSAALKFDFIQETGKIINYTNYNYSVSDMVNIQTGLFTPPQTDKKYDVFVREDALTLDNPDNPKTGTAKGSDWRVRGGPSTSFWNVGTLKENEKVNILGKSPKDHSGYFWYKIQYNRTWVNASPEDVSYYVNPTNFGQDTASYFQFLVLSQSAGLSVNEVNDKILRGKGMLDGKAKAFIDGGSAYNINEIYLLAHALLETGNGTSELAKGILVSEVGGKPVEPKLVYNMYGIGAVDVCPKKCGSEYAYKAGWFTPEAAIIGGADFIAKGYINNGQDTLYKMRWNPANPGSHQYATDMGWAYKQVNRIKSLYDLLDSYTLIFDVPKYK